MQRSDLDPELARLVRAVPLALLTAEGLGPLRQPSGPTPAARLARFAETTDGVITAIDTAGSTGRLLLSLISTVGGSIDADRLAYETAGADPADISTTIERLCDAGLVTRNGDGRVDLTQRVSEMWDWSANSSSLSDNQAITSDALGVICRHLGLTPMPTRKGERIAAITAVFADRPRAAKVLDSLTDDARKLLEAIAELDGLRPVLADLVDLPLFGLYAAEPPRFSHLRPTPSDPRVAALAELTVAGLVGINHYESRVWIWAEAWPALDRPIFHAWPAVARPTVVSRPEQAIRVPPIVMTFDRALRHWSSNPPPVLKNGELRLGKPVIRSLAKSLGTPETTVELIAQLAMTTKLLLPNEVSRSGRGRSLKVESAWMVDPDALATWNEQPPLRKWMNLVAYWSRSSPAWGSQLLANRLLTLWELSSLDPGSGFESAKQLAHWIEHRYGSIGVDQAVIEVLEELRTLDVITTDGPVDPDGTDAPVALTELGRLAIEDFERVADLDGGAASEAVVQADLTVIAPPDLDPALLARLASVATLESDAGALLYRLDELAIAAAIQDGESEDSIVGFLTDLSSVPVDDVVVRFVSDAAQQAEKLSIIDAPSVLVASDPVELAAAVKLKSAKLTPVTATVALSSLPAEKLRAALARRKLTPQVVVDTSSRPEPQRARDYAERLEQQATRYREHGSARNSEMMRAHADRLAAEAASARDTSTRWRAHTSFAIGVDALPEV